MNKWVKRKWVRALRSGEYEKGKYRLWSGDPENEYDLGYCCLGVLLCEMVPEFTRIDRGELWIGKGLQYTEESPYDPVNNQWVPDDLAILMDLSDSDQKALAKLNDNYDSFDPIADYIEENL